MRYYKEGDLENATKRWKEWISRIPSGYYTIQIEMACKKRSIDNNFKVLSEKERVYLLGKDFKGKRCYRILVGIYKSKDEAEAGKKGLPDSIKRQKPIIKKVSELL